MLRPAVRTGSTRFRCMAVILGALLSTALTAFTYAPRHSDPLPPSQLTLETERVASGLDTVTAIASPDDGSGRLLVAERTGTIRVYRPGEGLRPDAYLDLTDRVDTSGFERGLLGVATSPDFQRTRTLFVAYTSKPGGDVTLSRFRLESAGQPKVAPETEEVLIVQEHSQYPNHNGGQLAFGPDGYLYWGIGDGGGHGAPLRASQDLSTLLGKVVRIDAMHECGDKPYCIPRDNPFVHRRGARGEIWAYGLRNPWRFSFDPANGSLWIADVGENRHEEIDRLRPRQRGANLGWSCLEGPEIYNEDACRDDARYVDPIFSYPQENGNCSVTGGFVYRGEKYEEIAAGTYVMADWCTGNAWGIQRTGWDSYRTGRIGSVPDYVSAFGTTSHGELYLGTGDVRAGVGELYRVSFARR